MARKAIHRNSSSGTPREHGVALVLTLLIVAMLTVVVVGFNAATRTEQMASRNYGLQAGASAMAETAVGEALALLNRAIATNYLSQPGRMMLGGAQELLLSSASMAGAGAVTNLNALLPIQTAGAVNASYFGVPWVAVQGQAGGSNRAIGRYAFWIDDNGSRLNLNVAGAAVRTNFLPTNSRPLFAGAALQGTGIQANNFATDFSNRVTATQTNQPWGYFFTPRQLVTLRGGITNVQQLGYRTAGMNPNRPDPAYPLADGAPIDLNAGGTNGFLASVRSGFNGSESALLGVLDEVIDRQLSGERYEALFGQRNGFVQKYGRDVLRQMVANINDAYLPVSAQAFTGATASDMLSGLDSTGPNNPVPRSVLGLRPSPYLNEIAVSVVQSTNLPAFPAEIQIWMQSELVDPYSTGLGNGWEIKYKVRNLRFSGTYDLSGESQPFQNPQDSIDWNWDGGTLSVINEAGPQSGNYVVPSRAFVFEWQAGGLIPPGASNVVFTRVEVEPVLVVLRSVPGQANSVRDWAISNDFPVGHFVFNNPPQVPRGLGYNGYGAFPPDGVSFSLGIAKNDPRVRRFTQYDPPSDAWIPVGGAGNEPLTLGAGNSVVNFTNGTGIDGLGNDAAGSAVNIYDHSSFRGASISEDVPVGSGWSSGFDLSRVHTGLQWRTLQLRAQDAAEGAARFVPDWALLGVFAATNSAAPRPPVKVNINAVPFPAVTAEANLATLATGSNAVLRVDAFASLLSGNSGITNASNAVLQGIPFDSAFALAGPDSYLAAATNLATMRFGASWAGRRAGDLNEYLPQNAYLMPAEVLEVQGMYRTNVAESVNEGRVRGFYDALSTHSETFTIFAVGQALDAQGRSTGEQRLRVTVEKATNAAGVVQFRPVLTEFVASP